MGDPLHAQTTSKQSNRNMSWHELAEAVADVSHPSPANSPARMPRPFIPHRIF